MDSSGDQDCVVCIHDDRPRSIVGIKLAVLSLRTHCPGLPIVISFPDPPAAFCTWVESLTDVKIVSYPDLKKLGWNVKPILLLRLLEAGHDQVIWMDSDIIANGDALTPLLNYSHDTLVATQETYWAQENGGSFRTIAWGLTPGRNLPCTVNTGVMRVTHDHIPLLQAWQTMSNHPAFVHAQSLPWYERPLHMVGGQDVLTALLGSTEFPDLPIVLLKRGVDIAQCFDSAGFTATERFQSLSKGLPPLIHAMGFKPWQKMPQPPPLQDPQQSRLRSLRDYYSYLALELSPYIPIARHYREALDEDTTWMETKTPWGQLMEKVVASHPILQGLPLSLVESVIRRIRQQLNVKKYSIRPDLHLKESPLKQVTSE